MPIIVAIGVFVSIALLILGLTLRSERDTVRERIRQQAQTQTTTLPLSAVEQELTKPLAERVFRPFLHRLARIAERLTPRGSAENVDGKLNAAGRPWHINAREFIGLRVLSIIVFSVPTFVILRSMGGSILIRMAAAGLCVFVGVMLPDFMLARAAGERKAQIRRRLPDTLDLLMVSVEAGLGLDAAIQKVTEKLHGPLADEMRQALREMRLGKQRMEALRSMAQRAEVGELSMFVAAVYQADQLGVSISRVLKTQSQSLRSQRTQRAREVAAKLPIKMLFPLIFFIFPALFVVILAPGAIQAAKALGITP